MGGGYWEVDRPQMGVSFLRDPGDFAFDLPLSQPWKSSYPQKRGVSSRETLPPATMELRPGLRFGLGLHCGANEPATVASVGTELWGGGGVGPCCKVYFPPFLRRVNWNMKSYK